MLNVHHLELFFFVARAGGITAALRQIPYGIQQPAVSAQLSRLEESLGTRLFHRRPFSLTPAGCEVYEHIAPFFSKLDQLAGSVRGEAGQHLRLSASASVLREQLPSLLKSIQREIPDLRVTLREATQPVAERMLREHEVDLAVCLLETRPTAGLRCEALIKVPMVLLVETASGIQSASALLKSKDAPALITLPPRDHLSKIFQEELSRRGVVWQARIEASGLDLVEAYVGHGFGVGLSIQVPARKLPSNLTALPLRGFPQLAFGALWSGRLSAPATRFFELARERARALGKEWLK